MLHHHVPTATENHGGKKASLMENCAKKQHVDSHYEQWWKIQELSNKGDIRLKNGMENQLTTWCLPYRHGSTTDVHTFACQMMIFHKEQPLADHIAARLLSTGTVLYLGRAADGIQVYLYSEATVSIALKRKDLTVKHYDPHIYTCLVCSSFSKLSCFLIE